MIAESVWVETQTRGGIVKKIDQNFAAGIVWLVAPLTFIALSLNISTFIQTSGTVQNVFQKIIMSTELWAAIIGTIVGAIISSITTYRLNAIQESVKTKALSQSVQLKVMDITSHILVIREDLERLFLNISRDKSLSPWQIFEPAANLPQRVLFSTDEKVFVLGLLDQATINVVLNMETMSKTTIDLLTAASGLRLEIEGGMKNNRHVEGSKFETLLTQGEYGYLVPKFHKLNRLLGDILNLMREYDKDARFAMEGLERDISEKYGYSIKFNLLDRAFPISKSVDSKG